MDENKSITYFVTFTFVDSAGHVLNGSSDYTSVGGPISGMDDIKRAQSLLSKQMGTPCLIMSAQRFPL